MMLMFLNVQLRFMKARILILLVCMCAMLAACSHKSASMEEVSTDELGDEIIKTPGTIVDVQNRRIGASALRRAITASALGLNYTIYGASTLAKGLGHGASGSSKAGAIAAIATIAIISVDQYYAHKAHNVQVLTFKPSNGGQKQRFVQLIFKENGVIEPGASGRLVRYTASNEIRFEPTVPGKAESSVADEFVDIRYDEMVELQLIPEPKNERERAAIEKRAAASKKKAAAAQAKRENVEAVRNAEAIATSDDPSVLSKAASVPRIDVGEILADKTPGRVKPRKKGPGLRKADVRIISVN